jgi:hypothetical protein
MLTRSQNIVIHSLLNLENTPQMNLVDLYYVSQNNKQSFGTNMPQENIIQLCLTDEYFNKIKNKKIIIYKNNCDEYDTAEILGYKQIKYDLNLKNKINKNYKDIIDAIDNELLDDVTIDMLVDDKDIEISNILVNLKNSN